MTFGEKVKELRQEKKWTQKDLGNALGFTPEAIGSWERGKSVPSVNAIKEIAKVLDVPVGYLLGDAVKPTDGSEEAKAMLKVAENEINDLRAEKEKLLNEIEALKADKEDLHKRLQEEREKPKINEETDRLIMTINEVREENYKLKETIVHLAMKGAMN